MRYLSWMVLFALVAQADAEYRIWTARDGSGEVEAEYVRVNGPNVYLVRTNGESLKVPLSKLSDDDARYVQMLNPPRLSVDVDLEELDQDYDVQYSSDNGIKKSRRCTTKKYACEIQIERSDKRSYEPPLTCRLFWLSSRLLPQSERDGNLFREVVVMDRKDKVFHVSEITSKNKAWVWTPGMAGYKLEQEITSGSPRGWEYLSWDRYYGYLVVVQDENGNLLSVISDSVDLKKIAKDIMKADVGAELFKVGVRD